MANLLEEKFAQRDRAQNTPIQQAETMTRDAFRAASLAQRAEQAAMRESGVQSRFESGLSAREQAAGRRESGVQSRFETRRADSINRFETTMDLNERKQILDEDKTYLDMRLDEQAQKDKKEGQDQFAKFMDDEDSLAEKYGRNSDEFLAGTLSLAKKYPMALLVQPRLGSKLELYEKTYMDRGGHPDLPGALDEVGRFDPRTLTPEDARQYLGTIRAKWPGVANNKALNDTLDEKMKQVDVSGNRNAPMDEKSIRAEMDRKSEFVRKALSDMNTLTDPVHRASYVTEIQRAQKERDEMERRLGGAAPSPASEPVIGGIAPPKAATQPAFGAGGTIVVPPAAAPAKAPAAVRWTRDASGNPIPAP